MKMRALLLSTFMLFLPIALLAQSYTIAWNESDSLRGVPNKTAKRTGYLYNTTFSQKNILFRFDLSRMSEGHEAAMCFGDNCFYLFPGEDDPKVRAVQTLRELGDLYIYVDLVPNYKLGTSTVGFTFFDSTDVNDTIAFTTTFIIEPVSSIIEATSSELSLYPLPANDVVTLKGTSAGDVVGIDLYSAQGSIIRTYNTMRAPSRTLDISGLSSGSYHFLLTLSNGSVLRLPLSIIH